MIVEVKLFAVARQLAETDVIAVECSQPPTIGELRATLAEQCPSLSGVLPHAMFSVDQEYATNETRVAEGAEVACLPPVSGG